MLACGLMTPHEGMRLVQDFEPEADVSSLGIVHKAFRSMTVTLLAAGAPSFRLVEWASVLKHLASRIGKSFPSISERFVSLRCMLLEASELRDVTETGQTDRPGVAEVSALLAQERVPLTAAAMAVKLGLDSHSLSSRIRIGMLAGAVMADHERWDQMAFSSAAAAE